MDKTDALTGVRKRQQISAANKTVFAWIIAASIVIGICGVISQFLLRELFFNNKILSALSKTNTTLTQNIQAYDSLKTDVTKLVADTNLNLLKKGANSTALQVIIDALPTEENRSALATSMQNEVLGPAGITLNSFTIADDGSQGPAATVEGVASFEFTFAMTGSYAQIQQAIHNMERSIRPITVESIELQGSASQLKASITAATYYQPAKNVDLKDVKIKP